MSIGFGACANLVLSDNSGLLYAYSSFNINLKEHQKARETDDGEIWISRNVLIEPEIHEKRKKLPSGRKKIVVKRIPRPAPIYKYIGAGEVQVKNASGTWETEDQTDIMAFRILYQIFEQYQLQGKPPEHIFIFF